MELWVLLITLALVATTYGLYRLALAVGERQ
jgi:hypothetical protein